MRFLFAVFRAQESLAGKLRPRLGGRFNCSVHIPARVVDRFVCKNVSVFLRDRWRDDGAPYAVGGLVCFDYCKHEDRNQPMRPATQTNPVTETKAGVAKPMITATASCFVLCFQPNCRAFSTESLRVRWWSRRPSRDVCFDELPCNGCASRNRSIWLDDHHHDWAFLHEHSPSLTVSVSALGYQHRVDRQGTSGQGGGIRAALRCE